MCVGRGGGGEGRVRVCGEHIQISILRHTVLTTNYNFNADVVRAAKDNVSIIRIANYL